MPEFRNAWGPQQQTMRMLIPLLMQKKQHEENIGFKKQALQLKAQELKEEKDEGELKFKRDLDAAKIKWVSEMYKSAVEKGDPDTAKAFGT